MKLKHVAVIVIGVALYGATAKAEGLLERVAPAAEASEPARKNPWTGPYIEGALGLSAGTLDISEGGDSITLGDTAWGGHIGVGYDWAVPNSPVVLGLLARYELTDVGYSVLGEIGADAKDAWMVGGRVGYAPGAWMAYVLAGYRWSDLDPSENAIGDIDTSTWVLGGGLEVLLGQGWFAGVEYTAALESGETIEGVGLDATEHTGKVRVGYKF